MIIPVSTSKAEKYEALLPQIAGLLVGEKNLIANLANMAAALKEGLGFLWVGFYMVHSNDELVLGPFQGPVACTRIKKGKGVCGTGWGKEEALIVPDVDKFSGHIACSFASKSEIVLPVYKESKIIAILDVDSKIINDFDETDKEWLLKIVKLLN